MTDLHVLYSLTLPQHVVRMMQLNGGCLADQVKVDLTEDAGPFMHQGT